MYISAGLTNETVKLISSIMEHLFDLGQLVQQIADGSVSDPQVNMSLIVSSTDIVLKCINDLSNLHPSPVLHPSFRESKRVALKLRNFVEKQNFGEVSRRDSTHPDTVVFSYLGDLVVATLKMIDEISGHCMTLRLSNMADSSLTIDLLNQNPQAAIQYAFTLFETRLRERLGVESDVYGENLINAAFGNNGALKHGMTPAENRGVRNLMSGAYATFRNPNVHRIFGDDAQAVFAIIVLADLLMQVVNESENSC